LQDLFITYWLHVFIHTCSYFAPLALTSPHITYLYNIGRLIFYYVLKLIGI